MISEPSQDKNPIPENYSVVAHSNERIIMLSDGIFAITITLLVLEVRVPQIEPNLVAQELSTALLHLLPKILAYIVSFTVLGLYWIAHHNAFMHIIRHNRGLLWLNILFLMCVASMPFPTGLIVEYGQQQISLLIYACTLAITGFVLDIIWWYATTNKLVSEDTDTKFIEFAHRKILFPPITYLVAAGVSFFSLSLAKFLIVVVIVLYIVPNPIDHHYFKHHYKQLSRRFDQ